MVAMTPIAAKVAGYVRALQVQDFDRARAGDVLAQIVDDDYLNAKEKIDGDVWFSATASARKVHTENRSVRCQE
jgi:multidrug resistance efflux pump